MISTPPSAGTFTNRIVPVISIAVPKAGNETSTACKEAVGVDVVVTDVDVLVLSVVVALRNSSADPWTVATATRSSEDTERNMLMSN